MKTQFIRTSLIVAGLSVALFACERMDECVKPQEVSLDLPETPYDYATFFNGTVDVFLGVNNEQATLGRVLFYDTHLSVNNTISCGSCHKQSLGFSDNAKFSPGFENHPTLRNTLPIQNLSNNSFFTFGGSSLFWDGRANFLPSMVLMPITNHVEMGMADINAIVDRVKGLAYYKQLFINAYGTEEVTADHIGTALSSFVGSIFSNNTRFDLAEKNVIQLSGLEAEGKNLFFTKYNCNGCHQAQQFINGYQLGGGDGGFINIGLDEVYPDKGKEGVTHNPADNGKFRIPNLHNIALTAPYMHDGRFQTLDDVLNHYSHGIANSAGLDPRLKEANGQPKRLNITDHEKTALVAFMNSMTDYSMITDPKFSNPFKAR